MEKYGFVYIWYDRKRKMYYIGSHWGTEDDGYICSSNRMRDAYNRRKSDFKRRIIQKTDNRNLLLEMEFQWLSLIPDDQLGKKYYNYRKHRFGHWSNDHELASSVSKRISQKTKEAMYRPDVREKYLEGLKTRDTKSSDLEVREKRRQSMIGKNVGKDNSKALELAHAAIRGKPLSKEHKEKLRQLGCGKKLNSKRITCVHCGFEGNPGTIGRYHNNNCRQKAA